MCRHIYYWNIVNCDVKRPIYLTLPKTVKTAETPEYQDDLCPHNVIRGGGSSFCPVCLCVSVRLLQKKKKHQKQNKTDQHFWTVRDRDFKLCMQTQLMKLFQMTPGSITMWPLYYEWPIWTLLPPGAFVFHILSISFCPVCLSFCLCVCLHVSVSLCVSDPQNWSTLLNR